MQRPDVTVVVIALASRPASVETCLQALHPTLGARDEVLLVPAEPTGIDGGDLPYPWVRVVPRVPADTSAEAANAAVGLARHPVVVTVTSDVVVTPDWLSRLVAPLRDSTVAAVSARSNITTEIAPIGEPDYEPTTVPELVEFSQDWHWTHLGSRTEAHVLDGFCLAMRASAWKGVDGFAAGWDEPGLAVQHFSGRLVQASWTLLVADDVFVHRSEPGSAFDQHAVWEFRGVQDERQLRRTQELGGAVGIDPARLRRQYAEAPLPFPEPIRASPPPPHAEFPPPRVSLIVPTLNRPLLLRRALESVQSQTVLAAGSSHRVAVEVIVVNDGGPDIRSVIAEFAPRLAIRLIEHGRTRGRAAACNTGLAAALGELVGFLDDDDFLFPHHLENLVAAFDAAPSPRSLVHSYAVATLLSEELGQLVRSVVGDQPFNAEALAIGSTVASATVLAPTQLLREEGGFDERLPMFDDWELMLRLTRHGVAVRFVPVPTVEMFRHQRRVGHKEIRRTHEAL